MINYITKQTYTGKNWDILGSEGFDESCYFVTFKQAIKYLEGVSGSTMKGLTKAATLYRYKKQENEETGKVELKPIPFSVFDLDDITKKLGKRPAIKEVK